MRKPFDRLDTAREAKWDDKLPGRKWCSINRHGAIRRFPTFTALATAIRAEGKKIVIHDPNSRIRMNREWFI